MAYKVKVINPNGTFYFQTGFSSKDSAESWAKSYKEKGPDTQITYKVLPEGIVNFKKFLESCESIDGADKK